MSCMIIIIDIMSIRRMIDCRFIVLNSIDLLYQLFIFQYVLQSKFNVLTT